MSDKSQHTLTSPQPETFTSSEIQHDLASKLGGELCFALPLGNLSLLVDQIGSRGEYITTCSNDHDKSDHLGELFKIAVARLNESKRKESELLENNCKLKEENKRMQENEKLFSTELQRLLRCLKMVKPGIATPNGDDPEDIFNAVRRYLIESKSQQSSLSTKLAVLEGEKKKICEDLDVLKADLERANCQANKRLLDLKNSDNKLKAAKGSLASHRDKALQRDKVIDEMKEMMSHVYFPPEIVSRDVTGKLRWLADEHKKTCQDLGSMKADWEQTHRELDKSLQENKKISEDLDMARLNLEQAILEVSSAKDETEKSSWELQKRNINLKAAEDTALAWDNVISQTNKAVSVIKFPPEVISRDIAHKIRWLADEHMRTCKDLNIMEVDLEQANFRADKCCTELKAAELKVKRMDKIERIISPIGFPMDIQTKDTSVKVEQLADYYKENFIDSNIRWNPEEAIRILGNMKAKIVDEVSETVRVLVEKANVEATGMQNPDPKAYSSAPVADASQTELVQNTREATTNQQDITHAEQDYGSGERITVEVSADDPNDAHRSIPTVMQQQAQVMNTASSNNSSASAAGTRWGEHQMHYPLQQQQHALVWASGSAIAPQTFHNGVGIGYGYSPFWQFGAGHYHFDASGQMCYMPCYDARCGGAVLTNPQGSYNVQSHGQAPPLVVRVIRPPMVSNFL